MVICGTCTVAVGGGGGGAVAAIVGVVLAGAAVGPGTAVGPPTSGFAWYGVSPPMLLLILLVLLLQLVQLLLVTELLVLVLLPADPGRLELGDDKAGGWVVLVAVSCVVAPEGWAGPALAVLEQSGTRVRAGFLLVTTCGADFVSPVFLGDDDGHAAFLCRNVILAPLINDEEEVLAE